MRDLRFRYIWKHRESGYIHILDYSLSDIQVHNKYYFDKANFDLVSRDQYTGLTDDYNEMLYEGDIVSFIFEGQSFNGEIIYVDGAFYIRKSNSAIIEYLLFTYLDEGTWSNLEGNIYENKELLSDI